MNIPDSDLPRLVIIGGGFAGINIIQNLGKAPYQVVLLDKHNYHTFQPLLYQVATAGLEPDSIAYPFRKMFKTKGEFYFRMSEVTEVLPEQNLIKSNIGELSYDLLVIATGSTTNFFGNKAFEKLSMGMKNVPEALNIRSLLLQNFEKALLTSDLAERESLMNVVIVGAGPTGVELAGAIAELRKHVLPKDYPDLDFRRMNINLVEGLDRVLPPMSAHASRKAESYLKGLGVKVYLNTMVKDYDGRIITTNQKSMLTQNFFWAAGVNGAPIGGVRAESLVKGNRILVDTFNKLEGYQNIYAIGDVACMQTKDLPKGHPMLAQVAIQQGSNLARNLIALANKKKMRPFRYRDYGSMATIGRRLAVADLGKLKLHGTTAWFIWIFVHLMGLVGFRNKVVVFFNWAYNFFNYNRDIRLIIRPYNRKSETVKADY